MKYILKLMTSAFFLPFLILGGIIAVAKVIFVSTFGVSWIKGDEWYGVLLGKLNDFLLRLKK